MHLAPAPSGVHQPGRLQHVLAGPVREAGARQQRRVHQQPEPAGGERGLCGAEARHPVRRVPVSGDVRPPAARAAAASASPQPAAPASAAAAAAGASALRSGQLAFLRRRGCCCGGRCPEEEQLLPAQRLGEYVLRRPHHQSHRKFSREQANSVSDL